MAVQLNNISYKNPIDSTPVNFLLANVGDEIVIEHNISVFTAALSSSSAPFTFNNVDGYVGTPGTGWLTGGDFSKFNIGDTVFVCNYNTLTPAGGTAGLATIIDKLSNSEIQLNATFTLGLNTIAPETAVSIVKPITALFYKWNFIENSEGANFYSKIDGSTQIASITGLNPAAMGVNKPMTMLGAKTYQVGSIEVDEMGISNAPIYKSNFIIRHTTRITPIMLDTQFDDTVSGIAPAYFLNLKCLKSIFYYEARYFVNDPNAPQTLQKENILGNTGWFNENWNTGITNYSIDNLNFYETVGGANVPIPSVKLSTSEKTKFTFDIDNLTDSPFVAGQTKLILNFCKAPNDAGEYTLNTRDVKHNFVWETALLTVAAVPTAVNGANYADLSIRSIANLKAFLVSPNKITVAGRFDFDQAGIDVFEESNDPSYLFWVSIQDHTKTGTVSDRTNLLVDINSIYYQTNFPNLFALNSKLIPHDCPTYTAPYIEREKFTEDELVGYTSFYMDDMTGVTSFEITKYTAKIIAIETGSNDEFVLESKTLQIPANPQVNGLQHFNIVQARGLHVPSTEIRKNIVARYANARGYEFAYPFLTRWEYWQAAQNVNTFFLDSTQPNNGLNHDWQHYMQGKWELQFRSEVSVKVNGTPAVYSDSVNFIPFERNLSGENTSCIITTHDPVSLAPLVDGLGKKYILGYKNTLVRAEFTDIVDNFDPDTVIVLGIEVFEEGGYLGKRRMSSAYDSDSDTWFIPLAGQTRVKRTFVSTAPPPMIEIGKVIAEAEINFNAILGLIGKSKWKLTARIYGNKESDTSGLITYGQNYLGDQVVYMIANNPIDEPTQVLAPETIDCGSDLVWRVLADANSAEDLKNDRNTFLWWFNKDAVDTAVVSLYNSAGLVAVLTGSSTYGTPYDFGFYINGSDEKLVGYAVDWRKVLIAKGADTYYLKCNATTIFGVTSEKTSETYCLKQYTTDRANGTVRIEYTINGLLGLAENDKKFKDLGQLAWYNQHRFDGYFHYEKSAYTDDYVQYENGQKMWVKDEQEPEYTMLIKPVPFFKHDILRTDILQADDILVTDYNTRNFDNYYQKPVIKSGGYEPNWHPMLSKLAPVTLKFKQRFNNLKKFRS